jgi:ribosomal protein L32
LGAQRSGKHSIAYKTKLKGANVLVAAIMGAMVSCKNCGKEFRLRAVRINSEQSLKTDTFSNVNEVCPNCGEMNTYNQKSMIWREE